MASRNNNAPAPAQQAAVIPPAATTPAKAAATQRGLVRKLAARFGVDDDKMLETLKSTAFRQRANDPPVTNEQMMALLVVADQYHLNPFTKEIYAFPTEKGIVPIIGIDGWIRLANEHPQFQAMVFEYSPDGTPREDYYVETVIFRKDRTEPTRVREYLSECYRDTGPWNSHPRRMTRHKSTIQCIRVAFGFGGVYDPDEAERIREAQVIEGSLAPSGAGKPAVATPQALPGAQQQLTHVPVADLKHRIDTIGLLESEFLAHFEIGSVEELALKDVPEANRFLDEKARAVAGG